MVRQIIHIDENKCNGCGLCANACHEGAIDIVNGKAKLVRENFCDGFGDCLPGCPTGAITFENREAPAYDENAVAKAKAERNVKATTGSTGVCLMDRKEPDQTDINLMNWPIQVKLAPIQAPYFSGADLLIAADCTAYAYSRFHSEFIKDRVSLIACTKLDGVDYSDKFTEILRNNDIESVLVVRMEVPCCGGMERAVETAIERSGKVIPHGVVVVGINGEILDRR